MKNKSHINPLKVVRGYQNRREAKCEIQYLDKKILRVVKMTMSL